MCTSCGSQSKLDFETLDEATMIDAAKAAHEHGEAWHFHVLPPNCTFSPKTGVYTFFLELTDQNRRIAAFFNEKPVAVNKALLALLHGKDALDEKKEASGDLSDADRSLLDAITVASTAQRVWHHHMMFPSCALNAAHDKWRLFVEIDGKEPIVLDYAAEPSLLLNRIERVYFGIQ